MSFLCSCAGRRRKRDGSDDRQEYYRRRSRSASRTPPLASAAPAATPKVKRKFPSGIAPTPSVPSDLEDNSAAAVAAAKKNGKNAKAAAKVRDPAAKLPVKVADPKLKTAPKVTDVKLKDTSNIKDASNVKDTSKIKAASNIMDVSKTKDASKDEKRKPAETRTMGTMTAPGAGEVTGYEQTIVPRARGRSPPAVAAKMEVTLRSMRRPGPLVIAPPLADDVCGSSGSDTPTRGYEASVSSSDAASGSPRDAQTQCAFSDFSDDESSLLSLGREEGEYESTVSELRDASPGASGQEVWDPGFLQHDRIWMDIKSTLMDLISDKDSPAFHELHESMKPPDLTYCTVFRKLDGTVTHKAREDKKKARHSFGGVPADKVPGSRSKLNLIALRDEDGAERGVRRKVRDEGDGMEYEDLTPTSEYDDKLFTPDDEVTEYYFGRRTSSEPDVPLQTSQPQLAPDAKITEFYFGRGTTSDLDIPLMKSDSQITLRSFQGGTTSEALRSSMSAIWPAPTRDEKIGGSAVELTVPRTETDLPDKKEETTASEEGHPGTEQSPEMTQNVPVAEVPKVEVRLEERDVPAQSATEVETVTNEPVVEAAPEVKMRQKITSKPFDRSLSESSSRVVREGTPVAHDLKTQKELWRQGVAFEGKDFDLGDAEMESMEVEPVSPELHENNRHHPKRVTRRKETSQLRSFSLDYEKRSPKVVRKRPGRPIVVQPYSSTRVSLPPAKDHSKHKLKLKHEDRIDHPSSSLDDAGTDETADETPDFEPVLTEPAVASDREIPKDTKSSTPEKSDSSLAPTGILESPSELKSPSMVRSVTTGRFKVETKQPSERIKGSQDIDPNRKKSNSPDDEPATHVKSEPQTTVSQTTQKCVSKIPIAAKPKEKPMKHQQPSLFPTIDAESRFVSKPSEVKRSGKIELIDPPTDEEESEETKARRAKKTRNVGRFLPRGGLKELKTADIPQQQDDLADSEREIKKQESESSTTEPDLVIGHGSPHGSVDAQLLKFGNSLDESVSKGSPDVIVQCFGEVSAASEDKNQFEVPPESRSCDDFKTRDNTFEKSATLFSAASTSVETVISALKSGGSDLLEDDGLGSMDIDDVEEKTELETDNDFKDGKGSIEEACKEGRTDFTQTLADVSKDSLVNVASTIREKLSLKSSNNISPKTPDSVERKKLADPIVRGVEIIPSGSLTGNENITPVKNDVDPILISLSSEPSLETTVRSESAEKEKSQIPVTEARRSESEVFAPSGDSQSRITSPESPAALSDASSGSFPEDLMPLLSPVSSSPPETSPRSPSEVKTETSLPGSGCTSPKRISSISDSVHPLPKVETTVDQTPLGSRPPETTTATTITTTTKTPRVRLSDIVITGSGEEKLLALSTSPVNDIFLTDVSADRQSTSISPAFDQAVSPKQDDETAQRSRPTSDVFPKPIGPVSSTSQPLETSSSPPAIPDPSVSTSNTGLVETGSSTDKILGVLDIGGAPVRNESVPVVATSQISPTEDAVDTLAEKRDSFLPSERDTKRWTPSEANLDVLVVSDANDEAVKPDEEVKTEKNKTESEESKEKSPESSEKSGKTGAKLKKGVKKDGKSDKKSEKGEKKSKTKASAKVELPPFPPPDRPIRIAVRPSERIRALSKVSSASSTATRKSDSSDAVETSSDRESIATEGSISKEVASAPIAVDLKERDDKLDKAKEAGSATEQTRSGANERFSTDSIPTDSPIDSSPVLVQTGETFKSTEKVDDVRDSVTALVKDIIEIKSNVDTDISKDKAESRVSGADAKEPVKTMSNISPDRDSLDETSSKSAQRTPRYSLEKEIPQEITDGNLVSPLPSPKDSLDAQSRRDSELTIDSLHRDSLSDIVKAKSQSPCDSLDENISKVVSESVQPDHNVMGVVTPLSSPRDSLESSPTKSLQEVGKIKRASTVKSIDEDQILSFSSIWSPRISMQQASERVTSPVSETVVSQSAKIVDARPFLAPLFSAENQTPPWISDAVPEPGDSVPIRSPPRDSFEDVMSEPPVSNVQSHPLLASTSPNMSPIASQQASLEEGYKLTSKQLDRTASSESTQRDDVSSISSVTSPRDSLSSKRESSTTISDSRLSTTDTSVIDDILGVGSIALPKEWSESAPGSPQRTSLRASLAVEEVLSSSSAISPRDSFEETPGRRVLESPKLSQELRKDTGTSFSLQSTPRDSLDIELQTKPAESIPNTPHRESLIDSVHSAGTAASRTGRDSFDSEKSSSPRISQKDITESFHKYFSSLDPKLAGLRDSKMSSGSGDSRRSAASDSEFDIIDFTEPDLVVLTDLPEEHSTSEPGLPTPKSNSTSVTPRQDRTQSVLSGGFDIMYIDTSSFDDDKTPKVTSESESSPTREVAKVMEELASVLENAEKAFEADTSSASNKNSDTPVPAHGDSSKEKVPDKHIRGSTEATKEDMEKQLEKDHDVFRKIAESSMDIGFDVEASFEAMVNSILTPRSSGIIDEGTKEEAKDAASSNVSPVTETSDKKKSKQNVGIDPKRDTVKPETKKDREFSISEKNKPIVKDSPVPSAIQCKEAGDKNEKTSPKDTDPKREGVFKDPEDKVPHAHKGETGIRESTFGLAKKVQEILRRTPSTDSQTEECSKISTTKPLSKTSSVEVTDPVHVSTSSEYLEKRIVDYQRPEVAVDKHCQQLQDSEELEPSTSENLMSPDSKSNTSGEGSLQYANKDPNEVIKPSDSLKGQHLEKISSAVQELRPSGEIVLQKDTATVKDPDKSDFSAEKRGSPVQPPEATDSTTAIPERGVAALPEEILSQERKTQLKDSSQIPKGERDSNISVGQSESESEKSEMVKTTDNKAEVLSSIDSQTGGDKLNVASEREESTSINEKSSESSTEPSEKQKTVQPDAKKQTKTKSKSLSREKTDSYDAFSVAVEKNIPLPPDSEPLETEHERNLPDKEREELNTTGIGTILQQPKLDNLNENLQNVMPSEVDLKEKEDEKETEKRRAGDWSKSFSLESDGSEHTFGDVKEKLLTTARPDVKRTISSESALEKKTHKNTKGKLVSKSFSRNSEEGSVVLTESENKEPISLEAKPLLTLAESIINQAEEDISQINERSYKSGSESHEAKEKDSTEVKEDHSQNKEVPDSEHIPPHIENKTAISKPCSKTEISKEKGDDSGVEDDTTQDHSESDVPTQEKKQSSKKPKSRSREDINSEELADLIQKQLSIAGGQVDDSQPEWTGPIRREKKSRKSVKASKSRSISTEEKDALSDSSIVLPESPLTHVEPTAKSLTGVETGSPDDTPQMPVLRRFKSKSKSREDKTFETPLKDLPSSPESSREESSSEKPKSILKSSSKEKVPVESPPSSGEIKLFQEDASLSFGDPFSIQKADSATDVFKRSDPKPANDGVSTTLSETLDHLVTSTTFEKSRDQSIDDVVGDRRSIRKIKSRSSSREDEYPLPDSSFDEKFVTSITESKPREASKEFTDFAFSEPRSPRSLRRRSSSKSVSFEDDVILESVEDELAEAAQSESTEGKEDFESTDKSRKSKLERRKSPKKKSKSRPSDQELVFDSSFEAIPEDSPIFTENTANEEVGNVESYVKELSDSRDRAERSKSKSKSVTPDKTIPSKTDNTPLIQIEPLDTHDGENSIAIEEEKCKIERRKSPKKKSKSKSYDHDDVSSSSIPRHLIEERSLRYVVTPDRELGPTVRNVESVQKESIPSATDAAESGSDFDSFIKERSSKGRIERRKSPKKKSKPKIPSTDEEDITSSEMLIARVDEYFSSISGTDCKGSEGDLPDDEKQFTSLERRKSPKNKSKFKSAENEQISFSEDATVFENTSDIAKDERLVDSSQAQEGSDIFGEPLGENWLQQPKVERRKSPRKKSKSKSSTQESDIPKPSPSGGDFFLPTVPAFQIDKSEGVLGTSKKPPLTSTEGTQLSDLGLITSISQTEDEIARDPMSEDKPFKTKSKSRSKSSDLESNRTIEKRSSTHSQSEAEITDSSIKEERRDKSNLKGNSRSRDEPGEKSMTGHGSHNDAKETRSDTSLAEKGEAALIFENAATIRTENISSAGGTTRVENIQPGGAASLDRIIVTQDSTENVRLSSGSLMYPKAIDFFTTITSSRPESIEGQFPLSLPPSRTSLELLAQKSTESLASNVSWNFPPKVDVRTMFVGNVTSPSKADDETGGFFTDPSTGEPVDGIRPSDSSNLVPGSNPLSCDVTSTKSLSFEDALKAYREKNKKSENASIPEGRSKSLVLEGTSAISGGSSEFAKSQSIEDTHTTVSSSTEQEQGIAVLTKPSISRTFSASTDKVITKTSRSFEKSFEIPGSMEIFDKESTSAVAASHSKPTSRVNSTTSEKSVAKTQSFEISIEQPVSWDVEHLDLEQSPSVVSGSKPISRSSSASEAIASVETHVRGKENVTSKPSLSKPQSRASSNASDKSVSKSLEPVQKDIEQTTSWDVASFEADSTSMITRSKPISRSISMASEKGVVKAKDSFDNVFRQTSTSDVEVSENQPSSPVILRNKPPSRSSSTTSEKSISKPAFSFDEARPSKSEDTTTETTSQTKNIASESGVPIAVCAPLRWSAALPENIDLTQDPTAEQVKQRAEEEENIFEPSVAPQEQPPASRGKSTSSDNSGDKTDVPHIGVQKETNVNDSEAKASEERYPEKKAKSNTQEVSATPKSSPAPRKKTESLPNVAPASESTIKTTVQQTRIPSARSSPAPQKKSPTTESKSTLQDTKIPSARSSPAPQKKTTSSESRSESSQESRPTAAKPSPVPQKKSQPKSEKTDAKSSPILQKKSQPKSEKTDADGRLTATKSSPAPQRKTQPKPETSNAEARPTAAKSSPAPQRKHQPKLETTNAEVRLTAAKSSPAPQRKSQPQPKLETSVAEGGPIAAKSSPAPKPVDGATGKAVRSAVRSVLDAAKQFLGVDTPTPRREGSRSPARGTQPPSPAPSPAAARRRRARARRRAAATATGAPTAASAAPAAPLDWAAEVEAELPLDEDGDEDEAAAPPTPGARRKRQRHRRKRGPAPAAAPAAPAPPAAAASPATATATAAPAAPPAPVKRLKSCEEDSGDATGGSRPVSARSPDRASATPDDDPTPWSVVRTRRQLRRLRRDRKSRSADGGGGGEGFRFQDPARALRLSSGSSEAGGGGGGGAHVFYFAGGGDAR
ncbi:hypothetical protein R5R35_010844 [Gryllus longicercus]|uniref:Uncharacterized protein n=1 Tax=Gryllus longicercus TaxID=2509291 RepID=A0AAN9VU54_9ORTH